MLFLFLTNIGVKPQVIGANVPFKIFPGLYAVQQFTLYFHLVGGVRGRAAYLVVIIAGGTAEGVLCPFTVIECSFYLNPDCVHVLLCRISGGHIEQSAVEYG